MDPIADVAGQQGIGDSQIVGTHSQNPVLIVVLYDTAEDCRIVSVGNTDSFPVVAENLTVQEGRIVGV